jgi:DNA polymerase-4
MPPKSIGNIETTYRDMKTVDDVRRVVYMLSESVASRLREQNFKCRTVKLYIREYDLKSCDRQGKLETPSFLTNNIAEKAMEIFHTRYNFSKPLRSVGVRACDLVPDNISIQTNLFYDMEQDDKREKIAITIDKMRSMYGYDVIQRGVVLEDRKLTYIPPDYNRSEYRVGLFYY